ITRCWLFTYQTPASEAQLLLPPHLELVTHQECAFWNVVVCRIKSMRPQPLPTWVGIQYWHVAYRLYVRFHPQSGPPLEGLHFLRSDCDSRLIATSGNLMTDFNFHTAAVAVQEHNDTISIQVKSPDMPAQAKLQPQVPPQLPAYSAFTSLEEAAAFLKYKPRGISVDEEGNANIVQIVRQEEAWQSSLVSVENAEWSFFNDKNVRPEICYQVNPISYQWNRGQIVPGAR
ncbi:MAG TPA: DUF2071 domain-containing protein, partial [Abditibacteriaceae bacterium]